MSTTPVSEPPAFKAPARVQTIEADDTHHQSVAGGDGHRSPPPVPNPHSDEIDLNVPKPQAAWVVVAGMIGLVLIIAMLLTGLIPRHRDGKQLEADAAAAQNAPSLISTTQPVRGDKSVQITMPANMRPWQEVSLFARTTGYLKDYKVDISEDVEAGQLMAELDTPEIDQELSQAEASVQLATANREKANADLELATATLKRFEGMRQSQGVTLQQIDEKTAAQTAAKATSESAKASLESAEASVRRLQEMQNFKYISAPFSGVVTGRAYDRGSLITANPTATDIKPMFKIAQNNVLRAFVNVPQSAALRIRKGMEVSVSSRERPGRTFPGHVMGTTNYLDPMNRSLLTEVKVDNPREPGGEFALLPGMYVQVSFSVVRDTPPLVIPAPAVVANAEGTRVAVVVNNAAHFVNVKLGQDFGDKVEIVEGLNGDEQIITNPGERVYEGGPVSTGEPGKN